MKALKGGDKSDGDEFGSDESMVRCEWYHECMLCQAGEPSEFEHLGQWHMNCMHEDSPRRQLINYFILQSPLLPYSKQVIWQHLRRTEHWMRSPGRNSFRRGIKKIKKDLDCIWLKERRLLSGSCCNIMAVLFCLRVMSEIEEKAEEMIRKYRARQEFWPVCVQPVQNDDSDLVESVDFFRDPSQIADYLDHIRSIDGEYSYHIRRDKDTIHLFAQRFMRWRENAGGKLFRKLAQRYEEYLNCIVSRSTSILPGIPEARIIHKLLKLKAIFHLRFKYVLAGWPCRMEKALLCLYCHFLRVQKN